MSGELGHSEDLEEVPNTDDFDIAISLDYNCRVILSIG